MLKLEDGNAQLSNDYFGSRRKCVQRRYSISVVFIVSFLYSLAGSCLPTFRGPRYVDSASGER